MTHFISLNNWNNQISENYLSCKKMAFIVFPIEMTLHYYLFYSYIEKTSYQKCLTFNVILKRKLVEKYFFKYCNEFKRRNTK